MPLASISCSEETNMKTTLTKLLLVAGIATLSASSMAAEIVVIVNQKNPATRMFSEQAAQFFIGKSSLFTPIEHNDGAAIRNEFHTKVLGKDSSQVKAIWSKLVFTGKGTAPKEYGSSAEVKKAVAADPQAIGYIEKSAVDDSVKVILTVQ
jgi:ABC-type phosphate transport system substrate-binding protein